MSDQLGWLLDPGRVWSRTEVLDERNPVPASGGVYGWYFDEMPDAAIDTDRCHQIIGNRALLYVGISPGRPRVTGRPSSQTLRTRTRNHFRGQAEGSTLRLSLGCLLSGRLGIELRRVGSGKRLTFGDGEEILSRWLDDHAGVVWVEDHEPWLLEERLIDDLYLPLNLDQNKTHPFHPHLSKARAEAKARARELPPI